MVEINQEEFENIVSQAIDAIPDKYYSRISNVAFVTENEPTESQRQKLKLACNQTLYGLYEGIPLTKRGSGYNLVLPDKITIFKHPIQFNSQNLAELKANVHRTVWHEVAHYFGLAHEQIHKLGG